MRGTGALIAIAAAGVVALALAGPAPRRSPTSAPVTRPATGLARAGVVVDHRNREIRLQGEVLRLHEEDILEYFCCTAGTAEHESIVAVKVKPAQAVMLALMLPPFGLKPGSIIRWEEDGVKPPTGPTVLVFAEYKDPKTGKTVRVRVEDWILMEVKDPKTGKLVRKPMRRTGFVFAGGSFFTDERDGRRYFRADGDGAIVTVYNRNSSIIDNPQPEGASDEVWYPNFKRIPPPGTKVTVILKPVPPPATRPTSHRYGR